MKDFLLLGKMFLQVLAVVFLKQGGRKGWEGRRVEVNLDSDLEQREPVHLGLFNSTSKHHISFWVIVSEWGRYLETTTSREVDSYLDQCKHCRKSLVVRFITFLNFSFLTVRLTSRARAVALLALCESTSVSCPVTKWRLLPGWLCPCHKKSNRLCV